MDIDGDTVMGTVMVLFSGFGEVGGIVVGISDGDMEGYKGRSSASSARFR